MGHGVQLYDETNHYPHTRNEKKQLEMWKQKKVRLRNFEYDIITSKRPRLTPGIYLITVKLSQFGMLADNKRQIICKKVNSK